MINRRQLLLGSAAGIIGAGLSPKSFAQTAENTQVQTSQANGNYLPVVTPNGRTLPYRMRDGVKEFHLIAEEFEHEFAPGTTIKAWGYNGSTPGPTIEAVEGDRVRIYVTNKLREPTTVHWHGLLLPFGMDGVAGLTQPAIRPGETWVYEFPLIQHGTHMYHPHSDEMLQMAMGMMGMFIIHPREPEPQRIDRDFCLVTALMGHTPWHLSSRPKCND
jgi:manganese oxidase